MHVICIVCASTGWDSLSTLRMLKAASLRHPSLLLQCLVDPDCLPSRLLQDR